MIVMAGLVPAIHVLRVFRKKFVDGRSSPMGAKISQARAGISSFLFVIPAKAGIQPTVPPRRWCHT
jgi:hypothetical protein